MDIDLLAKLGALAIGAVSTLKLAYDWLYGRQGRIREEYKFAREFLADLERAPKMHPFLREKGYQAIAGDTRLAAGEIEYLLTLRDSPRALKDYVLGRPYLQHFATAGEKQLAFSPKFRSRWPRLWRKLWYLTLYFLFFAGAFLPLLLPALKALPPGQALVLFAFSFVLFVPPGFLALRAGVRIARAEALVEHQHKNPGGILLAQKLF
jgi:hypothetical protein